MFLVVGCYIDHTESIPRQNRTGFRRGGSSGPVSQNHSAGLARLCLYELERVSSHILKEWLPATHDDGMNDQPQLINQVCIHEAGDETCSTDNVYVFSWCSLQRPKFIEAPDDLCLWPRDAFKRGR